MKAVLNVPSVLERIPINITFTLNSLHLNIRREFVRKYNEAWNIK